MPTLHRLARAPLLHHSVQQALKDYIAANNFQTGDALPAETELARQLGVSRSSVREAIKGLETIGILESRRGSGVYVSAFSFDPLVEALPYGLMNGTRAIAELLDVRCTLEVGLAERIIAHRNNEQIAALSETLERFKALAQASLRLDHEDRIFHQNLAMNLQNHVLIGLIDVFWRSYHQASQHFNLLNTHPIATYRDHVAIFDAFVAGDAHAFRMAVDGHYDGIRSLLAAREGEPTTKP